MLREILEPSRTVDPKYTMYSAATRQGLVMTGLVLSRDEKQVVLLNAQNEKIPISVDEVDSLVPQKLSLMPEFLLRGLTPRRPPTCSSTS